MCCYDIKLPARGREGELNHDEERFTQLFKVSLV